MATDFEAGAAGWTHGKMPIVDPPPVQWTFDHWQLGNPSGNGPGGCNDGTGCWATNLTGNYISCQRAFLASPELDLSECSGDTVTLAFHHYYDFWTGFVGGQNWFDGGIVELSSDGGATWRSATVTDYSGTVRINPAMGVFECVESGNFHVHGQQGFVGDSGGWEQVVITVPDEFKTSSFRIRFAYASGVSGATSNENETMQFTRPGWYIDDVSLQATE